MMPGLAARQKERSVLYNLIVIGVVVACLVAIHFAFDALQRRNVPARSDSVGRQHLPSLDQPFVLRYTFPDIYRLDGARQLSMSASPDSTR
jgi:hypothetical protein